MKKTSTLLFILFVTFTASAQDISKGRIFLGGTLSFVRQKSESTEINNNGKYSWTNINPAIGKFYNNNRMAGINLFYSHEKRPFGNYTGNSYGGGVFSRQYLSLGKSFYLFAEEAVSFRRIKTEQESTAFKETSKTISVDLDFYPGLSYAITKRLFAELALVNIVSASYTKGDRTQVYNDGSPNQRTKSNSFGFSAGLGDNSLGYLGFGIRWLLK